MRLPIPEDCCAKARELIAGGLDPNTLLEFMRGDVLCLRGKASTVADRKLTTNNHGTPVHKLLTATQRRVAGLPIR